MGLCISLLDVTQVSEFYLLPGDGASHTKSMLYERGADYICSNAVQKMLLLLTLVKFQLIVFRPFIDEVLIGKVRSSSLEGLRGAYQ